MLVILLHNVKKVKVYILNLTTPRDDQTCLCVNSDQTKTEVAPQFKC